MKKLIRTIQSEVPFAKPAKDVWGLWSRRLRRRPHETDFRALSLLPDGCYIDIGANNGQSIIESILLFRASAQVVAFEPNPRFAAKLARRYRGRDSIQINDVGFGYLRQFQALHTGL